MTPDLMTPEQQFDAFVPPTWLQLVAECEEAVEDFRHVTRDDRVGLLIDGDLLMLIQHDHERRPGNPYQLSPWLEVYRWLRMVRWMVDYEIAARRPK